MKISIGRIFVIAWWTFCVLFVLAFLLTIIGVDLMFVPVFTILSGWVTYPIKVGPQIEYNFEMILCGLGALGLAMFFLNRLMRWFSSHLNALANPWLFSHTACLAFLILSMFGTSIAMTGIIHQAAWLMGSESITETRGVPSTLHQERDAYSLLHQLAEYASENEFDQRYPDRLEQLQGFNPSFSTRDHFVCNYRVGGPEPWLYPGAGKKLDQRFPVLVSPRPTKKGNIVVGYSILDVKVYDFDNLPPEIQKFF